MNKIIIGVLVLAVFIVGATTVLAATSPKSPAGIYADLKGIEVDKAYEERQTGKTFGQLAEEAGKLEEFKEAMLESKKAVIEERVKEGSLTREQADELIKHLEERISACTGEGLGKQFGKRSGLGFGMGPQGNGPGRGLRGRGFRGGSCFATQQAE